jgi:hypothetical protein
MRLEGHIETVLPGLIAGWARDAEAPERPLRLTACTGREALGDCIAAQARADLEAAGIGACGFAFVPPRPLTPGERDTLHFRAEGTADALFDDHGGPQPNPFLAAAPPRPARARFSSCILHIGTEKTGTTSLQRFLGLNRERLLAAGIFVPVSLAPAAAQGVLNHSDLVAISLAEWRMEDALRHARGATDAAGLARLRADSAAALAAEIATVPASCSTLLLSSEHCHSRLLRLHEIDALRGFLSPWVGRFEVLVYLRPQHELALSHYAMHLLAGRPPARALPTQQDAWPAGPAYFDYARLLARWSAVFGREAMRVARFDAGALAGGDVIEDACGRLGIDTAGWKRPDRLASGISARGQKFLAAFLARMAPLGQPEAGWMTDFVTANLRLSEPGHGNPPARAVVEAFAARFEAGNERVRADWFPARQRLFDLDFSGFPETEDDAPLSGEEMLDVLVGLLRAEVGRPGR